MNLVLVIKDVWNGEFVRLERYKKMKKINEVVDALVIELKKRKYLGKYRTCLKFMIGK